MAKTKALKVDIPLNFPITVDGKEIKQLTMRRAKVRDRLAVDQNDSLDGPSKEIAMIANLCEVKPDDLHAIDMTDYKEVQKALTDFLS